MIFSMERQDACSPPLKKMSVFKVKCVYILMTSLQLAGTVALLFQFQIWTHMVFFLIYNDDMFPDL